MQGAETVAVGKWRLPRRTGLLQAEPPGVAPRLLHFCLGDPLHFGPFAHRFIFPKIFLDMHIRFGMGHGNEPEKYTFEQVDNRP